MVVLLLVAHVLTAGASMWSAALQIELVERMYVGDYEVGEPEANDNRQRLFVLTSAGLHLLTMFAFLFWFRRVYDNLDALGRPVTKSLGGPIVAWFIPFVNFVRPYQIAKQIWLRSDPSGSGTLEDEAIATAHQDLGAAGANLLQHAPGWLSAWWALWIARSVVSTMTGQLQDPLSSAQGQIGASVLTAAAGVMAIVVVRQISERQRALASGDEPIVF